MALSKTGKFVWGDIFYAPFIYDTISDVPLFYQFAQPCCGFGVVFVVICGQWQVSLVEIFRDQSAAFRIRCWRAFSLLILWIASSILVSLSSVST